MPSRDEEGRPPPSADPAPSIVIPDAFRFDYPKAYAEICTAFQSGRLVAPDFEAQWRNLGRPPSRFPLLWARELSFDHVLVLPEEDSGEPPARRRRRPKVPDTLTFTVEEAGEKLGISRALAYEAVRTGQIPSIHIGRRILVPKAALARLLEAS